MAGRQPPHAAPAPHSRATASSSWAPASIAAQMRRSVTARQWQIYMCSSKATLTHLRRVPEPRLLGEVERVTSNQ